MNTIVAEYVWINGDGINMHSKSRTLPSSTKCLGQIPLWTCDGSSCGLATHSNSEIVLNPVALFADPFRGVGNLIVLCETYTSTGPTATNFRAIVQAI